MAKATRNGTLMKVIIGALTAILLAAVVWIWNAAGVVKDVEANTTSIAKTETVIKEEVKPKVAGNTESVIGLKKDIEWASAYS